VQITNEQVSLNQFGGGQPVPTGVGTGIVIDNNGDILTNDHVVRGAQKLLVTTANGKQEYPATLVGADPRTDLAVIRVQGAHLTPLPLGNSNNLQVGQWVVAIGNALALPGGPTVTAGVVSALDRTVQEPAPGESSGTGGPYLFDVIQTSAPINPGNSGGPLVDLNGNVVGINTLGAGMAEPGVQSQGIGFAIAINTAKKIAQELIAKGHVTYAFLGVGTISNTPALAQQYGLPTVPGVAVVEVVPGSPAQQAGIQPKDVITKVGSSAIRSTSDLQKVLTKYQPGQQVTVTWVSDRTGQTITKTVTLATAPTQ
jgi:S1-C subfamily serine protease